MKTIKIYISSFITYSIISLVLISCIGQGELQHNMQRALEKYDKIGVFGGYGAEGLALVEIGDSVGMINEYYEEVIPCFYKDIKPFFHNVTIAEMHEQKLVLLNSKGKTIKHLPYKEIWQLDANFPFYGAEYSLQSGNVIINSKGEEISPQYRDVSSPGYPNSKDRFLVAVDDENKKVGLFDCLSQKEFVSCIYDQIYVWKYCFEVICKIDPNRYLDHNNAYRGLLDLDGKEILPMKYSKISIYDDIAVVEEYLTKHVGLFDILSKRFVFPCKYQHIYHFSHDLFKVFRNRKLYAIIDSSGKQLGNHLFSDIGDYHHEYGLIEIAINKKWGYMNREGQIVLECYSDSEYSLPGPSAVYNSLQQ